jgi:hypothetical protein
MVVAVAVDVAVAVVVENCEARVLKGTRRVGSTARSL